MGSAFNIPPGNTAGPSFWRNEEDWIVLIEFLVDMTRKTVRTQRSPLDTCWDMRR
jgi:hypothetical protein